MTDDYDIRELVQIGITRCSASGEKDLAAAIAHVLRDHGVAAIPDPHASRSVTAEPSSCEWPVDSGWHKGLCGRSGHSVSPYGLRLCWQHADTMISEALARVAEGAAALEAVDALLNLFLKYDGEDWVLDDRYYQRWDDVINREILKRVRSGSLTTEIRDAVDDLIEARLAETWGDADASALTHSPDNPWGRITRKRAAS